MGPSSVRWIVLSYWPATVGRSAPIVRHVVQLLGDLIVSSVQVTSGRPVPTSTAFEHWKDDGVFEIVTLLLPGGRMSVHVTSVPGGMVGSAPRVTATR